MKFLMHLFIMSLKWMQHCIKVDPASFALTFYFNGELFEIKFVDGTYEVG